MLKFFYYFGQYEGRLPVGKGFLGGRELGGW